MLPGGELDTEQESTPRRLQANASSSFKILYTFFPGKYRSECVHGGMDVEPYYMEWAG